MSLRPAKPLSIAALSVISLLVLSACGTTRSGGNIAGPLVDRDGRYKSANLRSYTVRGKTYHPEIPQVGWSETGLASWYAYESPSATTANGEHFDTDQLAAAHKTLPLPSIAEVTNLDTGRKVRVRVNDRGPFVDGRIIDLSREAAKALGTYNSGTARVRVTFLGPADSAGAARAYGGPVRTRDDDLSYIVQIGAFSQRDNAEAAHDRLDGAQIRERNGLYIVYLGPFSGAAKAETYRQRAISAGFGDSVLRRDN
ncbi:MULTISPECIES: SPOR domain-containing protein [Asticcacaulis]|uniref:SPOR domain-containing protein n=1 Tax=Asticcacaulis TaxID=76890 RepID=UPI001AE7562E|nr:MULTISPECIES: SPOR domain-containing protein [Asticcacaulis]MBP2158271.1 rare lipoprotein A [Asticcacaulis solisilvae]MDR6799316.1 rare lipoprotein A [Asticcacaulis sp. BE141]